MQQVTYFLDTIETLKGWVDGPLLGDNFYEFTCAKCNGGCERVIRQAVSIPEATHIILYNMVRRDMCKPELVLNGIPFYRYSKVHAQVNFFFGTLFVKLTNS